MERKILFKAKKLSDGTWVEGYFYKECDNTYIIENRQKDSLLNRNEAVLVDPSTVCQFTGLKDKDGVWIWEHDILKYITEREVIFGRVGIFLKGSQHIISLFDVDAKIEDDKLIRWSNLGSKFDRKEV